MLLQSAAAGALSTLRALDPNTLSFAFAAPAKLGQLRGRPGLLGVYASVKDPTTAVAFGLTEHGTRQAADGLAVVDTALVRPVRLVDAR